MRVGDQEIEFNEATMEKMGVNEQQWEMILLFVSKIESLEQEIEILKKI